MALTLALPQEFTAKNLTETADVPGLVAAKSWTELNDAPVCIDQHGQITAHFGDSVWNCRPYFVGKGVDNNKKQFDFRELVDTPNLQLQAKLVVFGWLYHTGHKAGRAAKLSTLTSRFNTDLKRVFGYLLTQESDDLASLGTPDTWSAFLDHLQAKQYSKSSLEKTFAALNSISRLRGWLPFTLSLPTVNFKQLAKQLAAPDKQDKKQILAIPERLADRIYGEAIAQVEQAWPHREALTQLERELQANYVHGRAEIDAKIASGQWRWLNDSEGNLKKKTYAEEINKAMPESYATIIHRHLANTDLLSDGQADGNWFNRWVNQLLTACFICCGAFTGMRVSELFELNQNSFTTREFDGQTFHLVQSAHLKLVKGGKKQEEWLTSPIVEKAIELATAITTSQREQLRILADIAQKRAEQGKADEYQKAVDSLWLSQDNRGNPPIVIQRSQWNHRLARFAQRVDAVISQNDLAECRSINPQDNGAIDTKVVVDQPWPLTSHQFRRTFAVFTVRNNLGHAIAIKQQFKHLYLRMSEWYGNGAVLARVEDAMMDTDLQRLIDDTKAEHIATEYDHWYNSDELLAGGHGRAILAMRNDKPMIYSSWDSLYRLVKEGRLTLHGTLHSYCKNGYQCDMDGVINPAFCADCSNSVIDIEKAQWWQQRHTALTTYLSEQTNVSWAEYAHCIIQIRAAEVVMRDHQLDYETYQHPVEVINL